MYSKIALNNVKKSFKDYSIYFLTLTLAVCIFYSFNSIESQRALLEINKSDLESMEMLVSIISGISVFVSIILGCLILYANNFLIKKRKKELGIYMTLGMGKQKISKILVIETLMVGIISLLSGLILGIIFSQGLSLLTSKLFDSPMNEYRFVLSITAIGKTIVYFGIIFLLVMLFNAVIISRYKIIDLLTASRKNENIKTKNPLIYIITFIVACISIIVAYIIVRKVGLDINNPRFIMSIVLGVIGTFLIFFSLAGFGLNILKNSKNIYFKDLNIFILRQINSKVNTNFLSMSIICLMLFLTIGMLSTGLSFKDALEKGLEKNTPYDASARMSFKKEDKVKSIVEALSNLGYKLDENEEYVEYNTYHMKDSLNELVNKDINKDQLEKLNKIETYGTSLMPISEYNKIRKLDNQNTINLNENEVLITSNNTEIVNIINAKLKYNNKIHANNKAYTVKNKTVITDSLETSGFSSNLITLIVTDDFLNNVDLYDSISSNININYDNNSKASEEKYSSLFKSFFNGKIKDYDGFIVGITKEQAYSENKGMTTTVLFVGIYLGIVFLISSMAVLSLQQLSEASDSIDRYKSLKRIGANDKMINKTIFIQTIIYFTLPLGLALIHSIIGIDVVNEYIKMFGKPDIGTSSLITALIFIIVYIGYFYITYAGYKNIIKNSEEI